MKVETPRGPRATPQWPHPRKCLRNVGQLDPGCVPWKTPSLQAGILHRRSTLSPERTKDTLLRATGHHKPGGVLGATHLTLAHFYLLCPRTTPCSQTSRPAPWPAQLVPALCPTSPPPHPSLTWQSSPMSLSRRCPSLSVPTSAAIFLDKLACLLCTPGGLLTGKGRARMPPVAPSPSRTTCALPSCLASLNEFATVISTPENALILLCGPGCSTRGRELLSCSKKLSTSFAH